VAYRDDAGHKLEAPTAEGTLRLESGPRAVKVSIRTRSLHVVEKTVTLLDHRRKDRRLSYKIAGSLVVARDVPHEDLGIWIELPGGMRRIFGVEPVSLLELEGLPALAALDRLAAHLRAELAEHAGEIRRAIEIGRGLDKVLLADHGDHYVIYARRLFRDRARLAMTIHTDGRIQIIGGRGKPEITVRDRNRVDVTGDYIRFIGPDDKDLARFAIPWIMPEDRRELARRIGLLVHATAERRFPLAAADPFR
jgi:hypothetical protein